MRIEGTSLTKIGLDAAVVGNHRVAVRGPDRDDFSVSPLLGGLEELTKRLAVHAGALVVAEPTGMSWLSLGHAVADAGCDFALIQARHSSKLREALAGKNKTDIIDADVLTKCETLFELGPTVLPNADQLALRRAVRRRHVGVVDAHRAESRLWALANWAFPDVWMACGGHGLAQPLLARWPHLNQLARARRSSIADLVAAHTRSTKPLERAEHIGDAARGWVEFWANRVDLDALEWETVELLGDIAGADARIARAETQARRHWTQCWGDDEALLSLRGVGPNTACHVRAYMGELTQFDNAKQAVNYVGWNPSTRQSGLMNQPKRGITKEGPPELRLALYQAANVARRHDPQLAEHYRRLMVERGHNHISAQCAVARKLTTRIWKVLTTNQLYELRDLDGNKIDREQANTLAASLAVPEDVRRKSRARTAAQRRGRLHA